MGKKQEGVRIAWGISSARAGNVEATGKRKPFIPYLEVEMD